MRDKTFLNILRSIVFGITVGSAIVAYCENNDFAFTGWVVASLMTLHSFDFD